MLAQLSDNLKIFSYSVANIRYYLKSTQCQKLQKLIAITLSMSVILLNKSLSFFPVPRFCLMEITLASFNE